jgi:hypothetical protein
VHDDGGAGFGTEVWARAQRKFRFGPSPVGLFLSFTSLALQWRRSLPVGILLSFALLQGHSTHNYRTLACRTAQCFRKRM